MSDTRYLTGFHAVTARLRQHPHSVRAIYVLAARHDRRARELIERAEGVGVPVHPVDEKRLDAIAGSDRHQGVVAEVDAALPYRTLDDVLDGLDEPPLLVVLDGVTDPHNLGACLRVADAAGAHAVIAPRDRSAGLNATAAKVASGAAESVPYITVTNLARALRELKDAGVWVIGTAGEATASLYETKLDGPVAIVVGAEGEGMRRLTRETCDEVMNIPMAGTVESLNVSVASGVCLFEAVRQRQVKK